MALALTLSGCATYTSYIELKGPPCPNIDPFTPREHWCDPNYRPK